MNEERLSQFLDRVHGPFSWRPKPAVFWNESYGEIAEYYIREFRYVTPNEFDFDVYESQPFSWEGDGLHIMTVDAVLYYFPSFMSLVVQDIARSNDMPIAILSVLRSHQPGPKYNIKNWVKHAEEMNSFDDLLGQCRDIELRYHIEILRDWFLLKVSQCQNECIANMRKAERETVLEYLDISERLEADVLGMAPYSAWIHSVRSILLDHSLSNRLGAKNDSDILNLIRLIDLAVQKYPQCFPKPAAQSIKDELIHEMA